MVEIDKRKIEEILEIYKPEYCFLKKVEVNYPFFHGVFRTPSTLYTKKPLNHLTDVEVQLCLNQLAYVGFEEVIKEKLIPQLNSLNFKESQYDEMVIGKSEKKFKEIINPNKEIHGKLKIDKIFNLEGRIIALTSFDFENGKCIGRLNLALIKKE
ncbi:MAG TPA: FcoT family thioesterase [Candidatus Nanoarchaeia archaeon]|nr:FcoT family thioesterase [Candidatus Nanoarchaeia archaeon]